MEVILLERVEKLGQMGEVVNVKAGFARNYLLPQKKALRATKDNLTQFDTQRTHLEAHNLERRQEAEKVGESLDGVSVIIVRQASDNDQLYGSVTTRDISDALTEAGVSVDKRQVQLERPIKTVALHQVRVILHPEVTVTVTVNVARSEEEAEMQARGERRRDANEDEPDEAAEAAAAAAALFEVGQEPDSVDAEEEESDPAEAEPVPAEDGEEPQS